MRKELFKLPPSHCVLCSLVFDGLLSMYHFRESPLL
uniref:Uncharacterized protein n=1 Tax=Rhizophora mucronata TaxID=61149 RepID=A0A2P2NZL8_RHIMU